MYPGLIIVTDEKIVGLRKFQNFLKQLLGNKLKLSSSVTRLDILAILVVNLAIFISFGLFLYRFGYF